MLDYFLVYQLGFLRGLPTLLFYLVYISMVVFMLNRLPRTSTEWVFKLVEIALCWAAMQPVCAVYYSFFQESYLNQFQEISFTVLYALLLSRYPIGKRVVMGCAAWSSKMLVISIHGALGFSFALSDLLALTVCIALLVCFFLRFAVNEFPLAPGYYAVVVAAIAFSGGIAAGNWNPDPGQSLYTVLNNCVLLGTVLLVYYIFYRINSTYQHNLELMAVSQQQRAEAELQAITEKRTEELRVLRHELKNHDAYIQMLLDEKRYDELSDYVRQSSARLAASAGRVDCGNRLLSYILEQKLVLAELAGAEIRYQISVPPELPVEETELTSLLSNLLDNAIEACREREGRSVILLRMDIQRDYLFIHTENPFEPSVSGARRLTLETTKPDQAAHGYGTKIVRRIAEKYNGCAEYQVQGCVFISDVMLALTDTSEGR